MAVIARRLFTRFLFFTHRFEALGRTIAVIRVALRDEFFGVFFVEGEPLGLIVRRVRPADTRPFVPMKSEPLRASI